MIYGPVPLTAEEQARWDAMVAESERLAAMGDAAGAGAGAGLMGGTPMPRVPEVPVPRSESVKPVKLMWWQKDN